MKVPSPETDPTYSQLYNWMHRQLKSYKLLQEGKPTGITQERIEQLEAIGFGQKRVRRQRGWESMFAELVRYKKDNEGSLKVPTPKTDPAYRQLYQWISTQRNFYKLLQEGKTTGITQARIDELTRIGFEFDPQNSSWESMLADLKRYKEDNEGSLQVPATDPAYSQLYSWMRQQRQFYKQFKEGKPAKITQERIDELEKIGFTWSGKFGPQKSVLELSRRPNWESMFAKLKQYKEDNEGSLQVPKADPAYRQLYSWMVTQRQLYKRSREGKPAPITQARIDKLEKIGFQFGQKRVQNQSTWESMFAKLKQYKEDKEGSLQVPATDPAYRQLYNWMVTQRRYYNLLQKGKPTHITQERIVELERIGFTWSGRFK